MSERIVKVQPQLGMLWFAGWLFSLGFLELGFWKGVLAIFVWPYYIGVGLGVTG